MYSTEGKVKEPNAAADIGQGLMGLASSYAKKDMGGMLKGGMGILRAATGGAQKAGEYTKKTRTSAADVVSTCLSGGKGLIDSCGVADLLERLQGLSNECGHGRSWAGDWRHEPCRFPIPSRQSCDKYLTSLHIRRSSPSYLGTKT